MSDNNSHFNEQYNPLRDSEIANLYTRWNVPDFTVRKLDRWELWQPTKEELSLAVYKVHKIPQSDPHAPHYERHLLYKGNLYHLVWQNDSAEYFFTLRGKASDRFVISIRAIGDMKVALIQRKWR